MRKREQKIKIYIIISFIIIIICVLVLLLSFASESDPYSPAGEGSITIDRQNTRERAMEDTESESSIYDWEDEEYVIDESRPVTTETMEEETTSENTEEPVEADLEDTEEE